MKMSKKNESEKRTIETLSNREAVQKIRKGEMELKMGKKRPFEDVKKELYMGYYTILMISHDEIAMSLKPSVAYSNITEIISDSVRAGHTEKHVGGVKVRTIHYNEKDFKNILRMFKNEAGKWK